MCDKEPAHRTFIYCTYGKKSNKAGVGKMVSYIRQQIFPGELDPNLASITGFLHDAGSASYF